jgi:nitrate reductase NapE component
MEENDDARWISDEEMQPGLFQPQERQVRSSIARIWIPLLMLYLTLWGLLAGGLLLSGEVRSEDVFALLAIFVSPVMNILGLIAGFYFGARCRDTQPPPGFSRLPS